MADKQPSLMDILEAQTIARSQDLTGVSSGAAKQALLNLAALPNQRNLWNNSTAYAQQAAAQQAAPGKAFGYDPQQAAFMETLFNPMNPETNGRMGTRPNAMAGLTQQALAAQSLADRKAKGAGTMAALSLDQLDQSNRVSNSPLAQIAASPELMKLYPYMQQLGLNNQATIAGAAANTANAALPEQQEAIRQAGLEASKQFGYGADQSLAKALLPKGVYGGGNVSNPYGVPASPGVTIASEAPNLVAAANHSTKLPDTIANINGLNAAVDSLSGLTPGMVTNSPLTGVASQALDKVFGSGIAGRLGTKVDAGTFNAIQGQLQTAGLSPEAAAKAIYIDKEGNLTMNNTALTSAVNTANQAKSQEAYNQMAAGLVRDYTDSLKGQNQNANTAPTAAIVNKIQQQVSGTFGKLATNNGVGMDGKPVSGPNSALSSLVMFKMPDGRMLLQPMSSLMKDGPGLANGSWSTLKDSIASEVKSGNIASQAEIKRYLATPEGKAALAAARTNNGLPAEITMPPAKTSVTAGQPNDKMGKLFGNYPASR